MLLVRNALFCVSRMGQEISFSKRGEGDIKKHFSPKYIPLHIPCTKISKLISMTVLSVTSKNNLGNSYLDYDEKTTDLFTSMNYSNFKTLYDNLIEIGASTIVK